MVQNPQTLCQRHGLNYVESSELGLRRRRCGKGFSYLDPSGRTVRDKALKARIKALAIPPAWTDVCIARDDGKRSRAKAIVDAADEASEILANTRTVARSSYIHSSIIEAYKEGKLKESLLRGRLRNGLTKIESALMRFLERELELTQGSSQPAVWRPVSQKRSYFPFARCFARMAPATRLPAALDPYFLPALVAILEKFLPGLPMSLPARAALAE